MTTEAEVLAALNLLVEQWQGRFTLDLVQAALEAAEQVRKERVRKETVR
jgi:hypothetical protein